MPARYLIACPDGHLDEFPYDWWVHEGAHCTRTTHPELAMSDTSQRGAIAFISCRACGARRGMVQAQGEEGRRRILCGPDPLAYTNPSRFRQTFDHPQWMSIARKRTIP